MITLHQCPSQLDRLDMTLSELPDDTLAAVLARPRTTVVCADGIGAAALYAALELIALDR